MASWIDGVAMKKKIQFKIQSLLRRSASNKILIFGEYDLNVGFSIRLSTLRPFAKFSFELVSLVPP